MLPNMSAADRKVGASPGGRGQAARGDTPGSWPRGTEGE